MLLVWVDFLFYFHSCIHLIFNKISTLRIAKLWILRLLRLKEVRFMPLTNYHVLTLNSLNVLNVLSAISHSLQVTCITWIQIAWEHAQRAHISQSAFAIDINRNQNIRTTPNDKSLAMIIKSVIFNMLCSFIMLLCFIVRINEEFAQGETPTMNK